MAPNPTTQLWFELPSLPRVRKVLVAPAQETAIDNIRRQELATALLNYPNELTEEINTILRERRVRERDPAAFIDAVRLAGAYRLTGCAPALVELIDVTDGNFVLAYTGRGPVVIHALTEIGKPAVPAILALASEESTSGGKLQRAGEVLRRIEGDLTPHVIEDFISKSADPQRTRRMLEREPFVRAWKSSATRATGPATRPAGSGS